MLPTLRLALSKGPHRVGATPFPTKFLSDDRSRANFPNVVFKEKLWTVDKALKSKCIIPSLEPFRIEFNAELQTLV
jgi:hypothetical protein